MFDGHIDREALAKEKSQATSSVAATPAVHFLAEDDAMDIDPPAASNKQPTQPTMKSVRRFFFFCDSSHSFQIMKTVKGVAVSSDQPANINKKRKLNPPERLRNRSARRKPRGTLLKQARAIRSVPFNIPSVAPLIQNGQTGSTEAMDVDQLGNTEAMDIDQIGNTTPPPGSPPNIIIPAAQADLDELKNLMQDRSDVRYRDHTRFTDERTSNNISRAVSTNIQDRVPAHFENEARALNKRRISSKDVRIFFLLLECSSLLLACSTHQGEWTQEFAYL